MIKFREDMVKSNKVATWVFGLTSILSWIVARYYCTRVSEEVIWKLLLLFRTTAYCFAVCITITLVAKVIKIANEI